MVEIFYAGAAMWGLSAALLALFAHLRNHSDSFRKSYEDQSGALLNRRLHDLYREYLEGGIREMRTRLEKQAAQSAVTLVSSQEAPGDIVGILEARLQQTTKDLALTPEESQRIRRVMGNVVERVNHYEEEIKRFEDTWKAEADAAESLLKSIFAVVVMGAALILYDFLGSNPSASPAAAVIFVFAVLFLAMWAMEFFTKFRDARSNQQEYVAFIRTEFYGIPSTAPPE